jgi:hypothetical protein
MKAKQLAILLIVVAGLGYAWLSLSKRNQASWSESGSGGGKVVDFPINDVAHVVIKDSASELNLVKKADQWTVKERADYPASFEQVSGLIRKLWDLKTVQEVKVGPSQLPRLELVEPGKGDKSGTLVQLLGAEDKPIAAMLVGKKHMRKSDGGDMGFGGAEGGFPAGRYVKPAGGQKVSLVSETLDEVDPKPERWLSKDFIKIEGSKSITVDGPQKWSVSRESATADWKLADAKPEEKLDTGKVAALGTVFASPSFTDVLAPDAKLEDPVTTANVETFDGFKYELKIGKPTGENYPVTVKVSGEFPKERTPGKDEKPEDKTKLDGEFVVKQKQLEEKLAKEKKMEGRPYLVARFTVDPLLKERSGLFPDKPAEPAAPAPGATTPPISVTTPPISVPPPPAGSPPKIEAVTPPVQAPPLPPKPPATPAPKLEVVTPPVSAPPLPPPAPPAPKPPETPAVPPPAPNPPAPAPPAPPPPNAEPAKPAPAPPAPPAKPEPAPAPNSEPAPPPKSEPAPPPKSEPAPPAKSEPAPPPKNEPEPPAKGEPEPKPN